MNKEFIYIDQSAIEFGNQPTYFENLYPQKVNVLKSQTCYQYESTSGFPHHELLVRMLDRTYDPKQKIDSVIFTCTKLESLGLAGQFQLQSLAERFSLPFPIAPVFGYGCAGLPGIIKHHLHGVERTLWLSADCVGFSDTRLLGNDALMSDAAGYCVLSKTSGRFKIVDTLFEQDGSFHMIDKEHDRWNKNYFLYINLLFRKLLKNNSLDITQIKYILPHFTNLAAWKLFQRVMKFNDEQLFEDPIGKIGHLYGLDLIYSLNDLDRNHLLKPGDQLIFLSVGVGASFSAMLIEVCA